MYTCPLHFETASKPLPASYPPSPHPPHPTPLGRYRALGRAPCVSRQLALAGCFTHSRVCVSEPLSFWSTLSFPCGDHKSVLHSWPADRFISTIFLDSVYMHKNTMFVFLSLTYFTLCNRLWVHALQFNWLRFVPFCGWVIFRCIEAPQLLFPFICWWTSRLLLCPGNCKWCCS